MRILVTGGAGFVGSNLCARLMEDENNEVWCLDNLSTGRMENIKQFLKNPRFTFLEQNVQEPLKLDVQQIYHTACPASPPAYQKDPVDTTRTCVLGTLNMLELAKKCDAALLNFSTSEVYGDPQEHPQREDYRGNVNPIGVRSCYDEGKRCAESLCFDYAREYNTAVKDIRIFNTYGKNMDPEDGRVVSNFIIQALKGEDLTVYGDGSQTRSFCHVDDLVEGIMRMMHTPREVTGPVNLGNPGEFTVMELAEKVLEKTGSKSKIVCLPLPMDDPVRRKPDITQARKLLGWEPKISLDEGLDRTIRYFEEGLRVWQRT